ncbi:hypothetical protein ACJX0J_035664 [Zea mays]
MFVVDSIFNLIAYRQFLRIEDLRAHGLYWTCEIKFCICDLTAVMYLHMGGSLVYGLTLCAYASTILKIQIYYLLLGQAVNDTTRITIVEDPMSHKIGLATIPVTGILPLVSEKRKEFWKTSCYIFFLWPSQNLVPVFANSLRTMVNVTIMMQYQPTTHE